MNRVKLRHLKESLHRRLHVILKLPFAMVFKKLGQSGHKRIWLIMDGNGDRWNDSGKAFFEYVTKNREDIKAYAVYTGSDETEIPPSMLLKPLSFRAISLTLSAEAIFSTHSHKKFGGRLVVNCSNAVKVFMNHGVTGIKRMYPIKSELNNYDIVCCSSQLEKNYLIEAGYWEDQVVQTGFPRHDSLAAYGANRQCSGRYILYTPTFRDWASDSDEDKYAEMLFAWIDDLRKQCPDLNVKTWIHPAWYKRIKGGLKQKSQTEVLKYDADVQKLLVHAEILVTDYSSIALDAGLLGIPVVLFRPDKDEFSVKRGLYPHAQPSEIDAEVFDEDSLLEKLHLLVQQEQTYERHKQACRKWAQLHINEFSGNNCRNLANAVDSLLKKNS